MNAAERAYFLHVLRNHRDSIAQSWYRAIAGTSFVPLSPADIRRRLAELTDHLIDGLLAEPFDPRAIQPIGAALAQLHYMQPESLEYTLNLLAQQLGSPLGGERHSSIHERIAALFSALATGFYRQSAQMILTQQERIRDALLSERVRVETALRESEARFRAIFDDAAIGIALIDAYGRVVESNAAMHTLLGRSREELILQPLARFTHPDDVAIDSELYRQVAIGIRRSYQLEKRFLHTDGWLICGYLNVSLIRDASGQPKFTLIMVEDISERKRMEALLAEAQRRMAERLEGERRHFAHELHDGAVQQLLGISYQLVEQRRAVGAYPEAAELDPRPALDDIRREILGVVSQLRSLISELRPAGLEELGLTTALTGYIARLQREGGAAAPAIIADLDKIDASLPQPIAFCLFRAAQEALRNALKHASAQRITVRLRLFTEQVVLTVHDDGCGFRAPARLSEFAMDDHFGLVGIAERVGAAGGQCTIRSWPARGTHIAVRIPLHDARSDDDQADPRGAGR